VKQETVHVIKKTVVDVQYNGTADGFALQKEVQDWFDRLVTELNMQLNHSVGEDEMISIDALELQIDINSKQWKEDATRQLLFQAQDKIMLLRSGSVATNTFRKTTLVQHLEDEFLFYLRHGYLSWKSSLVPAKDWKQSVNKLFETADNVFAEKLFAELKENTNSINRLSESVTLSAIWHIFDFLFCNNDEYKKVQKEFVLSSQKFKEKNDAEVNVVKSLLRRVSRLKNGARKKEEVSDFIQAPTKEEKKIQSAVFTTRSNLSELNQTDGIFISNTGLVIVAAFLPAFFEKLKLYDGVALQNHTDAVCLLHYLARGEKPTDEFELVLPKILCGLEPEAVIHANNFSVQKKWKKETEDVLTSAIEYWNVLGNTSVEGLRESFLQRKGKLSYNGSTWNLQAEQQPYDMLLQHLPWNISMIQLPWMKQMLQTEWIY
jgi:Contractile injection system tape measure protein